MGCAYPKNILSYPEVSIKECAARLSESPMGICQCDRPTGFMPQSLTVKAKKMPFSLHLPRSTVFRQHNSNEPRT